jgi:cysteine-rich repeat protein
MEKKSKKRETKKETTLVLVLVLGLILVAGFASACTSCGYCGDGILQPGEQCDDGNTISHDGCSAICKTESFCPLDENDYDEVIIINQKLVSKELVGDYKFNSPEIPVSLSPGKYSVTLVARDNYTGRESATQPNEQYKLAFIKNTAQVGITPPTSDLPDYVEFAQVTEIVINDLSLPNGADHIQAFHAKFSEIPTQSPNSHTAVCVGIKKVSEPPKYCGDGVVNQANESCDDGNNNNNDGCSSTCKIEQCGDGIKQTNEECDDGNSNNLDSCRNDCTLPYCGDGIKDAGEECDFNGLNGVLCIPPYGGSCSYCSLNCDNVSIPGGYCGDGIKQNGEACDDGNTNDLDSCRNDCTLPFCGDGKLDVGEACDDGNLVNNDGCSSSCTIERCGDGILQTGEECDDGNTDEGDGCSSECEFEEEECVHDVGVRYSYGNSFGTGIGVKEGDEWISEKPAELTKGKDHQIKYYIDNKIPLTTNNIHVTLKLDGSSVFEYDYLIGSFHSKTLSLDVSELECDSTHTLYLEVEKINEIDCNLTDNSAQRQIKIKCEVQHFCGDGILDAGEECDDGNTDNGDGCSSECEIEEEEHYCGDGITDLFLEEECDDGINNGIPCIPGYGGTCTYCSDVCEEITLTDGYCGDGILQGQYEECDDGNSDNGDGCSSSCNIEEEECVEDISIRYSYSNSFGTGIAIGALNGTWFKGNPVNLEKGEYNIRYYIDNAFPANPNHAHIVVKLDNSILSEYDYTVNTYHSKTIGLNTSNMGCFSLHNVSVTVYSEGNQVCEQDDECDNFALRWFNINCVPEPYCGDGHVDAGEECDDGNTDNGDGCSANCQIEEQPYCGDGIKQSNEQCDDGNSNNLDSCRNDCTLPHCGDGIKDSNEQCDDGNSNNLDSCRNDCTLPHCGDGIKDSNEQCDDGNSNNLDSCRNDCTLPYCGDGIKDSNEQCDDGNSNNLDSCRNDCTLPHCGDGIKDSNEQCDDGNSNNLDSCRNDCTLPHCGDGIKDLFLDEDCDLGSNNGKVCTPSYNNECTYCSNSCKQITLTDGYCGDGIRQREYEECDDGNFINGDGCSKLCKKEKTICVGSECGLTPNITTNDFPPTIWMCDSRVVLDDNVQWGRISQGGQILAERTNNYAFEGEQIQWNILILDKNGIEKVRDVYVTLDGNIEANCKLVRILHEQEEIDHSCNARIGEEELNISRYNNVLAEYTCTLTVESPDSMYGEYYVTVEAEDLDGIIGTMDETEYWFFNPLVSLGISGEMEFGNIVQGTTGYSEPVLISNDADYGSGVMLDMFLSGTNFYDSSSSGAMCPTSNKLSLKQFSYYASNGAYSTENDLRKNAEGYVKINYGNTFNRAFYGANEIILMTNNKTEYSVGNLLSPGSEMSLIFRLDLPEPCNGDFDSGKIYFWGEAV